MAGASWRPEPEHDQTLEENWLFQLRRERYRSASTGLAHDYYVLRLADAVSVVAVTAEGQVVLVRQFRAGSGLDSLETPGGLVNPGEDPLEAGPRELLEETGYAGDAPVSLGTAWSNPSLMSSKITTILVTNARKVAGVKLDHGEEVEVELFHEDEVPALLRDGRVDHALAVMSLQAWLLHRLDRP